MTTYFCKKYQIELSLDDIKNKHKGRCFSVKRGHRKGRSCKCLVRY